MVLLNITYLFTKKDNTESKQQLKQLIMYSPKIEHLSIQ
jgi:hypothetical protein